MKIHPVISITNIESLPPGKDPYKYQYDNHPPLIEEDGTEENNLNKKWKSFYIKKLLNQQLCCYEHGKKIIKYFIK